MRKLLTATTLLAVLLQGAALASTETAEIHACQLAKAGTIRIVDATTTCRDSEIKLVWNVQGPEGPEGPKGDDGAAAPTYSAGSGLALSADHVFTVTGAPWAGLTDIPAGFSDGTDNVDGGTAADVDCAVSCVSDSEIAGTISAGKLAGGIGGSLILDNSLTAGDLAGAYNGAVESVPGAVTSEKILDNTVEARDLAPGAANDSLLMTSVIMEFDPDPIVAMTRTAHQIPVFNLEPGDMVTVSPPTGLHDDLLFVGSGPINNGAVTVYLYNNSTTAIDDGTQTWSIQYLDLTP